MLLWIALLLSSTFTGILYSIYLQRQTPTKEEAAERLEETEKPGWLGRLLSPAMRLTYEERIRFAGGMRGLDAKQFFAIKLASALLLPVLITLLSSGSGRLLALVGGGVGYLLPDLWLNGRFCARRRQVQEELSLFAELIAASVSAGLSLTEAVRRVAVDAPGLVAREFLRAIQEMAAGKSRTDAWKDLMNRLPGEELHIIVTAIMQAEQYGTSVADVIRYQIQQIRTFKRVRCNHKVRWQS